MRVMTVLLRMTRLLMSRIRPMILMMRMGMSTRRGFILMGEASDDCPVDEDAATCPGIDVGRGA
eukprot:3286658-Prorocentrum_lima.AAC.1